MEFRKSLPSLIVMLSVAALLVSPDARADGGTVGDPLLEQLTRFNGGCPPNPVEEPGGCIDVQFSIHRAPLCFEGPSAEVGLVGFDDSLIVYYLSTVQEFAAPGDPSPIAGGSSTLIRTTDGVSTTLTTTELAPNTPHTMWWVGFNPDNPCIAACNCGQDTLNAATDSFIWATGAVTDALGTATFAANLEYGETPDGQDQIPFAPDFDNGIEEGAEIHFFIRAHGPALTGGSNNDGDDDDDDDDN